MASTYPDWVGVAIGTAVSMLGMRSAIALAIKGKSIEGWTPVEGELDELETKVEKHIGYNNTVIEARYSYMYRGVQYIGRRVSALEESPRLWSGPYQYEAMQLRVALKNSQSIRLFVNSANPKEAVLLRFSLVPYCLRSIVLFMLGITVLGFSSLSSINASSMLLGIILGFGAYVLVMSWNQGVIRL